MGQSLSSVYVHLVFSTKGREPLLTGVLRGQMHAYLAGVVEEIKTSSSRWIKTQRKGLGGLHWQSGSGGFSVSPGELKRVAEYIDQPENHHGGLSFEEEDRRFLKTYAVEYGECYVWD